MREEVRDPERLQHIIGSIDMLIEARGKHCVEDLIKDTIIFYGFSRGLEIIGEAVYMLSKELKQRHDNIPWRDIEKLRHIIVHGYYKVNPHIVWEVIENDIEDLRPQIVAVLDSLTSNI